jgi:hypothetical protein
MNKAIQAVIGIIIAFGLAFGQQPADPPRPNITGTVTDPSGALIPGAKVSLFRTTDSVPVAVTKTDGKGEFQFLFREVQELILVAEANCFKPTTVEGIVAKRDGHTEIPPIILQVKVCTGDAVEPLPVMPDPSELFKSLGPSKKQTTTAIHGQAFDACGEPFAHGTVKLTASGDSGLVASTQTDSDGEFVFEDLPFKTYDLHFESAGFEPHVEAVTVSETSDFKILVKVNREDLVIYCPSTPPVRYDPAPMPTSLTEDGLMVGQMNAGDVCCDGCATLSPAQTKAHLRHITELKPPLLGDPFRVRGVLLMKVGIDENGGVISVRCISGHPFIVGSAIAAVMNWKFIPRRVDGMPKPACGLLVLSVTANERQIRMKVLATVPNGSALK